MAFLYLLGAKVVKIRQKRAKSSFFFYIWHVYVVFFSTISTTLKAISLPTRANSSRGPPIIIFSGGGTQEYCRRCVYLRLEDVVGGES